MTNPHATPKLSPLARCPGQYPNIPTSFTRRSLRRVEGSFLLGPSIIDKRPFHPSPPPLCRRRRCALRSKCGPLRYAQYLRLARDLSLRRGGSSEKEPGLNGYIAGFLADPEVRIYLHATRGKRGDATQCEVARSKTFPDCITRTRQGKKGENSLRPYIPMDYQHRHFNHPHRNLHPIYLTFVTLFSSLISHARKTRREHMRDLFLLLVIGNIEALDVQEKRVEIYSPP